MFFRTWWQKMQGLGLVHAKHDRNHGGRWMQQLHSGAASIASTCPSLAANAGKIQFSWLCLSEMPKSQRTVSIQFHQQIDACQIWGWEAQWAGMVLQSQNDHQALATSHLTCSVCPSTSGDAKSLVPGTSPIWPDTYNCTGPSTHAAKI